MNDTDRAPLLAGRVAERMPEVILYVRCGATIGESLDCVFTPESILSDVAHAYCVEAACALTYPHTAAEVVVLAYENALRAQRAAPLEQLVNVEIGNRLADELLARRAETCAWLSNSSPSTNYGAW